MLNKKIKVPNSETNPDPQPNPSLLRQIKSRKVGFLTREEYKAKKAYLAEFKLRLKDNEKI